MNVRTNGRELQLSDVKAVRRMLKNKWGVKFQNYNKLVGKVLKKRALKAFDRWAKGWRPSDTIGKVCFSWFRWVLTYYSPGKHPYGLLDEIKDLGHETHHYFQQMQCEGETKAAKSSWFYLNYYRQASYRMHKECDANLVELAIQYACTGGMSVMGEWGAMKRIYHFNESTLESGLEILRNGADAIKKGGRGTSFSPVADDIIKCLIGTGFLRLV